jgi:hypothetical protein
VGNEPVGPADPPVGLPDPPVPPVVPPVPPVVPPVPPVVPPPVVPPVPPVVPPVPPVVPPVVPVLATTLLTIETVQVTVLPPPLPEPLHWLTRTGSADVSVEEPVAHCSRIVPPPPFAEPLHCVIAALVVVPRLSHSNVGAVPPPWADVLHWLTVAALGVDDPVMLLMMCTLQVTVPPAPLPEPSHCVTDVTSWVELVAQGVQVGGALAAPWHSVPVVLELVAPLDRSRLLVTVTSQATA